MLCKLNNMPDMKSVSTSLMPDQCKAWFCFDKDDIAGLLIMAFDLAEQLLGVCVYFMSWYVAVQTLREHHSSGER